MATLIYLLKFCICSAFVFMAGTIIFYLIIEWGKRELKREVEYDKYYVKIQGCIRNWPVTSINYFTILDEIGELKNLKYKNTEKTKVLKDNFYWKYRTIAKQRAKGTCEITIGNEIIIVEL